LAPHLTANGAAAAPLLEPAAQTPTPLYHYASMLVGEMITTTVGLE
jgi:hypothetical protein